MFSIEKVKYFIPSKQYLVEKDYAYFNLDPLQAKTFSRIYGLKTIPSAEDLNMLEFIQKSVELVLEGIDPGSIRVLIHAHTANIIVPFGQSVIRDIQANLKLSSALTFGTTLNNCASTMNALEMASLLLQDQGVDAKAIIVTGEKAFTSSVKVIPNSSITGDAAAAILISNQGSANRLISMHLHTAGQYARGIWSAPEESKDFEKNYIPMLADTILTALKKANITLSDISIILPHNVNLISWFSLANYLHLPKEKIYLNNVKRCGHCFGSDILINYADASANNLIKPGNYFLMVTVGLGATFAAAVFRC